MYISAKEERVGDGMTRASQARCERDRRREYMGQGECSKPPVPSRQRDEELEAAFQRYMSAPQGELKERRRAEWMRLEPRTVFVKGFKERFQPSKDGARDAA